MISKKQRRAMFAINSSANNTILNMELIDDDYVFNVDKSPIFTENIYDKKYSGDMFKPFMTLKQIGKEMGVCSQRVRQIEQRAMSKLRKTCRKLKLKPEDLI